MKFDRVSPCAKCPFRTDVQPYLTKQRMRDLRHALTERGEDFACHETLVRASSGDTRASIKSQHCAGSLILLKRVGTLLENQALLMACRLGLLDPKKLNMQAPVFGNWTKAIKAQGN